MNNKQKQAGLSSHAEVKKMEMTDREYVRKKLAPELRRYVVRSGRKEIFGGERKTEL